MLSIQEFRMLIERQIRESQRPKRSPCYLATDRARVNPSSADSKDDNVLKLKSETSAVHK